MIKNNNNNNNNNSNNKKPRKYTKALCNFFYELTSLTRDVIKALPLIQNLEGQNVLQSRKLKGHTLRFLPIMCLF